MTVYSLIVDELFKTKSLAALVYLINNGRELEFLFDGKECFISKSGSKKYVSLWVEGVEQSFNSVEQLIANAVIDEKSFLFIWDEIEIQYLF